MTTAPIARTRRDIDPAGSGRRWTALALLATAQLMLILDVTVVNVALPAIGTSLRLGRGELPWVMTAYTVCFGGLMLLGGRIADRYGPRRLALAGLVVFTGASLLSGLAPGPAWLLAGRAAQGTGAALLSPAALATVLTMFAGKDRDQAIGAWSILAGLGAALGVILGGVLTSTLGWRWIFFINVPIGTALLVAVALIVPPRRTGSPADGSTSALDVRGAVLVTAGTGAAIYGLINAGSAGWGAPSTLLALAVAVAGWAMFYVAERRAASPLLAVGLLLRRPVAAGGLLMLAATGLLVGGFFLGSFSLARADGYSAVHVGLLFIPAAIATVAGAHSGSRLLSKIPAQAVAVTGLLLAAAGYGAAAWWTGPAAVAAGLAIAALGAGGCFVTAFTASLGGATAAEGGLRSAIVNTFHELGGAAGVAVLSSVAGAALVAIHPVAADFRGAFTVGAVFALVAALVAAFLVPPVLRMPGDGRPAH